MGHPLPEARDLLARAVREGFDDYQGAFRTLTRRARERFERQEWAGLQDDSVLRLGLYGQVVEATLSTVRRLAGEVGAEGDRDLFARVRGAYAEAVRGRPDRELAETFFNSVARRLFTSFGVDPALEFTAATPPERADPPVFRTLVHAGSTADLLRRVLEGAALRGPWRSLEDDVALGARAVEAAATAWGGPARIVAADVVSSVFFRNKGAYLVGRLRYEGGVAPLIVSILNDGRLAVDAVLLTEDDASLVFSFTRSYFHVECDRPYDLVWFLKSIMPAKKVAELYISIGHNKHGKTELFRDIVRHLAGSDDPFCLAEGDRGMVMLVFTLPSHDLVFKVIRDRFAEPKATTRAKVMEKYALVFRHDRAGRLIDAQEFRDLQLPRARFSEALLADLRDSASGSVAFLGDEIVVRHLYVERRVSPLNLYLRSADAAAAEAAVVDYGCALRDLAATNIFPGDLLLKNFGVTRQGRVISYDYDELALLTDLRFRALPEASTHEEEMAAEPWFHVAENEIFPEELVRFLELQGPLRALFLERHGDLLDVPFWRGMQERLRAGEVVDLFPYPAARRLRP